MDNQVIKSDWTVDQSKLQLVKQTICKGINDQEFELFLHICKRTGLDPFAKQIYAIPRDGKMTIQVSIDGSRLIADRTQRYSPGKEPIYNKDDKGQLISATSFIKKQTPDGTWHEVASTAYLDEYKPKWKNDFWVSKPHIMLAKCAEAAALRKAFPAELSGFYVKEEMDQADAEPITLDESKVVAIPVEETLTSAQIMELRELVGEQSDLIEQIIKGYKKSKLEDIPQKAFPNIVSRVNQVIESRKLAVAR